MGNAAKKKYRGDKNFDGRRTLCGGCRVSCSDIVAITPSIERGKADFHVFRFESAQGTSGAT